VRVPLFVAAKQRLRLLWGRPGLRRLAQNISWLLADRIARLVGGLLVGFWVARYLGPTAFGSYNYALALALIVGAVATLGLDNIVVRDLVRAPDEAPTTLGSAALLRLGSGTLAVAVAVCAAALLRPNDPTAIALTALISLASPLQALSTIDLWFQSRVRARDVVLARNAAFLAATLLKVALILSGAPLIAFGWAFAAEAALGGIAVAGAYRRGGGAITAWRATRPRARALLADSWPLIFSSLLVTLYLRIDQVMIGQMVGDAELGVYSVAVRIAEVFPMLPVAIITSAFPAVVAAHDVDEALFYDRLRRLYALVAALGYVAALGVTLCAPWMITILAGPGYGAAAPMLVVLTWASIFSGIGVARSTYLNASNLARLHTATVALGCLTNIGLNWLLIPRFGGLGAAIASLVAYWLAGHGSCYLLPELRPTGRMITRALIWPKFW
jgi:O-antigen/teichoic acid export membrane protein